MASISPASWLNHPLSKSTRRILFVAALFLGMLTLAGPVYAQAQLNIDGFYTQVQNTSEWWDQTWRSTFLGLGAPSVSGVSQVYDVMMQLVRLIAAITLTIYIVTMFTILARDGLAALQFMFRGLLVIILISVIFLGNGSNYGSIAYAGKILFNRVTTAMLQANINGVSISNALTDQIVTSKSKAVLEREIKVCDALPNPAVILPESLSGNFPLDEQNPGLNPDQVAAVRRLNCYYRVGELANDLRKEAARQQCWGIPGVNYACAAAARFLSGFYDDLVDSYTQELDKLKSGQFPDPSGLDPLIVFRDYVLGNTAIGFFQGLMYALQYFFANLQELILFLWALTAPVMAAYSIFPFSNIGGLLQWGITYLSIILSQAYYLLVVAIFTSLIQSSDTALLGDILFPFVLGLGAWLIATSLAAGGAILAVRSLTNAGITAISTVGSLGAAALAGPIGGGIAGASAARSTASGAGRTVRSRPAPTR